MGAWWAYIYPTVVGRFKPTDSNRKFADAAVGRAKNHAKIVAACIQTMLEYYQDPSKQHLFEKSMIERFLPNAKYTDISYEDVIGIAKEWGDKQYNVKIFCVPGVPQYIDGVSYWIAENISGSECYLNKVINYRKSLIG